MKIKVLIIEDMEQAATALEQQLRHYSQPCLTDKARTIDQALQRLQVANHREDYYDLILCDYNMGEGTNGQQLLEYLRSERLIPRKTGFIMVTAESSYSKVASAVELIPDAYLLKPFTLDGLSERIDFALGKRAALRQAIDYLDQEEPDYAAATKACNAVVLAANKYALEALKLKTECLLLQEQWGEAASVFDKILAWRATPWAEVGLARAIRLMGDPDLAHRKLAKTIEKFPRFVSAYDELAALELETGDSKQAQATLENAHSVVPSNRRTRELGLLALQNNDLEKATEFLKIVAERDRYGLKRSTEDFFALATAYRRLGKHEEALSVIEKIKDHFPETKPLTLRKMAAEANILLAAQRKFDAKKKALDALEIHENQMDPRAQLELAEACYQCDMKDAAEEIFVHVAENWQESPKVISAVRESMQRAGMGDYGTDRLDGSIKELIRLNNLAAAQIRQGAYDEAVSNLEKVAKRLLRNATVQANYTQALLLWIEHKSPKRPKDLPSNSKPQQYLMLAREHLRQLASIDSKHRHLESLRKLMSKLSGENHSLDDVQGIETTQEASTMEKGR